MIVSWLDSDSGTTLIDEDGSGTETTQLSYTIANAVSAEYSLNGGAYVATASSPPAITVPARCDPPSTVLIRAVAADGTRDATPAEASMVMQPAAGCTPPPPPPSPPPVSFPRSIWTKSSIPAAQLAQVKSLGFGFAQVDPNIVQLNAVQAAGMRAIVWLGNVSDPPACSWNWSDDRIRTDIAAIRNHPAVAYYFVADEPHAPCAQRMRERTALVRSLDPMKPTFMTENRREDFAALAGITDIFGIIRYPCSYSSGGCVPSKITESMNTARAAGITSWWGVPQVFHEPSGGYYRAPSSAELQAILAAWEADPGTVGYFFYTWGDGCCGNDIGLLNHAELWDTVRVENGG